MNRGQNLDEMLTKTVSVDEQDKENISPLLKSTGNVPSLLPGTRTRHLSNSSSSSSSSKSSSSSSSSSSDEEAKINTNPVASTSEGAGQITTEANTSEGQKIIKGKKRVRNEANWKSIIAKTVSTQNRVCLK
ncbi:hypothetical protein HHI36_000170 [Cryptolaemus montrouzieri]|uniref:Uncharacterized protein n=1 Tax=Cryptolaemus montrouzieri TaxID=559131 RepID=A0ABD2P4I9_9CUCU